jgi:hypothetical protein
VPSLGSGRQKCYISFLSGSISVLENEELEIVYARTGYTIHTPLFYFPDRDKRNSSARRHTSSP